MNRRPQADSFIRKGMLSLSLISCLLSGCVYRQLVISTPPEQAGAIVQVNGKTVGATPVDVPFDYYGDQHITLMRDGYQTLTVIQPVPAPWYEYFPLDFVSEHLIPFPIRDTRRLHYNLEKLRDVTPEEIKSQADLFRIRGLHIGTPGQQGVTPAFRPPVPPQIEPNSSLEPLPIPRPVPSNQEPPLEGPQLEG